MKPFWFETNSMLLLSSNSSKIKLSLSPISLLSTKPK